ncbi:MAG: class I SAM-dependent methyltransferase [Chloroflexota bacterium]|jgi:ribosomal protein L11 methylase PrmA|nr:class I SAM-dependent methyltransferase [Chloroflexota bacterium]MDP6758405.1 class I SAM-dependent methyltransferase [Chloroflexota bacterium]
MLDTAGPGPVWDLGANTGEFSRLALDHSTPVVSLDFDPGAVEISYRQMTRDGETGLFPLVADLTNPTPPTGWANRERRSLLERGPAHTVIALALTHHLAISHNVPFGRLADFFAGLTRHLIVEFVPAADPMAARLLAMRNHDFPDYTVAAFESALDGRFTICRREPIAGSDRVLYLMETR